MPEQIKLEELEAYRVERTNAQREGRPCKYKNPRDVYAADPNRDSYLVERDEEELEAEQEQLDNLKSGAANPSTYLADPGQEVAEALALDDQAHIPSHQNVMPTPNPENVATGVSAEESDEEVDIPGQTRDYTDEEKEQSALLGPNTESPNHPTPVGAVTTTQSPEETTTPTSVVNEAPSLVEDANPHAEELNKEEEGINE